MAKLNTHLLAFNRGEVSKIALARIDLAKLALATECQVNWMPLKVGPAMLRPGLRFVGEVFEDNACEFIEFIYSATDTALLELTDSTLRVWINEALVVRPAIGTVVSDPNFAGGGSWSTADTTGGCTATIGGGVAALTATALGGLARIKQTLSIAGGDQGKEHGLNVVVANGPVTIRVGSTAGASDYLAQTIIDSGYHALAFTPTGASAFLQIESTDQWTKTLTSVTLGVGVIAIPTPWTAADLPNLRWAQSKDIVYVAAYGKQQYKIERRGTRPGARGWSVVQYRSSDGPFHATADLDNVTMTPAAPFGNTTITSSQPFFNSGHVGALLRLFTPEQTVPTVLGGLNAATAPVRVTGVGVAARDYTWLVSGTFNATVQLERSFVGPDSGFAQVPATPTGASGQLAYILLVGGPFQVGESVFGATSSASGRVTQVIPATGTTGTLALVGIAGGAFSNAEQLTGQISGAVAVVNGVLVPQPSILGAPGALVSATGTGQTPDLDNVVAWERLRLIGYTSGAVTVSSGYPDGSGYGIARILVVNSSTEVTVEVLSPFSAATATELWQISDWCPAFGWPSSVRFQEGRLWWFSGGTIPIAASVSNAYTSYAQQDDQGNSLGDAGAILEDFGEGPSDRINWALGLSRLIAGRERSASSMRSSSFDAPMTPTDFIAKDCSVQGAARLTAVKIGKRGIFVERSGVRVYELFFNPEAGDYDDNDLTKYNVDIAAPGLVDIDVAVQPDTMIYLPRKDGQVACLLYDPNDEVVAWWRLMTLGIVENVRVLPDPSGGDDLVYFCVRRIVNGVSRRFIERLTARDDNVGGAINLLLDCHVTYSGAPVSSISLPQLPLTTVSVWADGVFIGTGTTDGAGLLSPLPDNQAHDNIVAGLAGTEVAGSASTGAFAVPAALNGLPGEFFADQQPSGRMVHVGTLVPSAGQVALPSGWQASSIVGYFGFMAPLMSAKLAYGARFGTALTQKKKLDAVGLVGYDIDTTALQIGQRFDTLDPLPLVEDDDDVNEGNVWSQYDEPVIDIPGEWDTDARLCLLGQAPFPAKLGALVVSVTTNEK